MSGAGGSGPEALGCLHSAAALGANGLIAPAQYPGQDFLSQAHSPKRVSIASSNNCTKFNGISGRDRRRWQASGRLSALGSPGRARPQRLKDKVLFAKGSVVDSCLSREPFMPLQTTPVSFASPFILGSFATKSTPAHGDTYTAREVLPTLCQEPT
ncbi:hypothetical protein BDV93DRAFT_540024 [Ceratobasidium sp. AG-I]|nr:hypothetical protein BDV93DRAFT_540024 [Ceratobasidium sp. AG-I]